MLEEAGREAVGHQVQIFDSRLVSLASTLDLRAVVLVVRSVFSLNLPPRSSLSSPVECFLKGEATHHKLLASISANEGEPRSVMNSFRHVNL